MIPEGVATLPDLRSMSLYVLVSLREQKKNPGEQRFSTMAPFYAPQNFNSHFEAGAGIQYHLLQSGGMAVDTPHVPHNTPEGEVGKPEGLSGSQIAANSLVCILTLPLLRSIKKCKLCNDSSQ